MKTRSILFMLCLASICFVFLTGCDNLTRQRFDMITVNVDMQPDVERMIGQPNNKLPGRWHYERVDKHLNVFIEFDDGGTVTDKEWIDALNETWDSTKDPGDEPYYESTKIRKSQQ